MSVSPHAATFRDEAGNIVGTTCGDTTCWFPKPPSRFAAVSSDGRREHVLRCGYCIGCREYERRILCRRLADTYREYRGDLWVVCFACALTAQAALRRRIRRSRIGLSAVGFYRLGSQGFALIATARLTSSSVPRWLASSWRSCEPIRRSRGRRAFNPLSQGLLRSRDDFGPWRKRWYQRGLQPRKKEAWQVETRGGMRRRHNIVGGMVRAWEDGVSLFPPEAWQLPRLLRRRRPEATRFSLTPEVNSLIERIVLHAALPPRERAFPVNRGARERASRSSSLDSSCVAGAGDGLPRAGWFPPSLSTAAPAARTSLPDQRSQILLRAGYQGSGQLLPADLAQWTERMRAKVRGP